MTSNVLITHRQHGKLVERREVHNVWTTYGSQYLAELISSGPPLRVDRIRYMGLGIGGVLQRSVLATLAPLSTSYPAGSAERRWPPNYTLDGYTNGNEYNQQDPTSPRILTLERPIRRTGSTAAYPGEPGDRWLIEPPNLWHTHQSLQELTIHARVSAPSGDFIYGPFTADGIPVSEAALFTSAASPVAAPYQAVVAYVGFGTMQLGATSELELVWRVRFG